MFDNKYHFKSPFLFGDHGSPRHFIVGGIVVFFVIIGFLVQTDIVRGQEPVEPLAPPDAENGLVLYEDRCAGCHGPSGAGDGDGLPADSEVVPPDFTDEAYRQTAIPSDMFLTITNGRMEALMPPFGPSNPQNPIDEPGRWDLVAAIYGLATPVEAIEEGLLVYEENCLACHGEEGAGDGPEADGMDPAPTDLTDLRYWANHSNQMVFDALKDTSITGHDYQLADAELWSVVDYSRTFSYDYFNPQLANEPIPSATISGLVTNGTTGEIVAGGEVELRTFTTELEELAPQIAAVNAEGRFIFDLSDVDPNLVYLTTVVYGDLDFNSAPGRLDRNDPVLDMPVSVYEKTADPGAVSVQNVHMVFEFIGDRLQVSEIYVLSNTGTEVFTGKSGDANNGTIEFGLPAGAENVTFQRSFDSFGNFRSATEIVQSETGWVDTIPLRPGSGAMNILVNYDMPFEDGMLLAHPLFYNTANATVVMPDVGVTIEGEGWINQGSQQMGEAGTFVSYGRSSIAAGEALNLQLDGRPGSPNTSLSNISPVGIDSTTGLFLGGFILLLVLATAFFMLRSWQQVGQEPQKRNNQQLLVAVVALDEAYENGEMDQEKYEARRKQLINELVQNWDQ